ncbi:hypothetical protein GH714_004522 [Hevea brasiliensis]|uniref:Uncharacterized protein n=1 Tax=Hevea brasiliensis TaxID=3981 RepID=A0A6A6NFL9_HEVBR|nr:hypothetical protein GH714_004522 [Hevea brasiliensis]
MIQIDKLQDKVPDPAGKGGPVFGAGKKKGATFTVNEDVKLKRLIEWFVNRRGTNVMLRKSNVKRYEQL